MGERQGLCEIVLMLIQWHQGLGKLLPFVASILRLVALVSAVVCLSRACYREL